MSKTTAKVIVIAAGAFLVLYVYRRYYPQSDPAFRAWFETHS